MTGYFAQNRIQFLKNLLVCEPQNREAQCFQFSLTCTISLPLKGVNVTVHLDDDLCSKAAEIYDVLAVNRLLAAEFDPQLFVAQCSPEFGLCRGW